MGAGMQIPPNGVKVARQLGFLDKLQQVATTIEAVELRRYDNGKQLCEVTEEQCRKEYGDPWMAVHRADFHNALWRTCQELGASLDLNMEVERIDFENGTVYMEDGDEISGDVIIGADGMGGGGGPGKTFAQRIVADMSHEQRSSVRLPRAAPRYAFAAD